MSEIAKHTPGPWYPGIYWYPAHSNAEGGVMRTDLRLPIECGANSAFCVEVIQRENGLEAELLANARLIAAAPDLLEALKAMLAHSCVADADPEDKDPEDLDAERKALVAIAKATGAP